VSWPLVKLSEVAEIFNGKTPSKKEQRESGFPVLKIKDISDKGLFKGVFESFVDESLADKFKSKKIKLDDTLILNAAHNADYVGNKQYRAQKTVVGSLPTGEWLLARAIEEQLCPRFLNYWLRSSETRFKMKLLVKGIHLYPKDVARLEIPLPPLDEQKRIAAILDKADAIRHKRQQAIRLADDFLRSVFLDMFGDPIANNKKWNIKELGELAPNKGDMVDGPFGSSVNTKTDYIDDGEIPVIRTKNVSLSGEFITDDLKLMKREKYETIIRSNVVPGDIVLTKVGTIGNVCIFPQEFKEAVLSTTGSCRIRVDESRINKTYLYYFLKYYRPKMHEIASAGVQPFLNMKHIKGFKVPIPDKKLQERFADVVNKTSGSKALLYDSSKFKLFESLSQKAFAGEL